MTYIPWSSDFALYLEDFLMYEQYYLRLWVSITQSLTSRLYFMVQWFCIISWRLFDVCTSYFGSMKQYDQTFDLKNNVGHCDLYSMVQRFCLISWRLFWCMNIIIWDYESVWPKVLPQDKYRSLWPSDFVLYLEDYLMYEHHTLGLRVSMTWRLTSK